MLGQVQLVDRDRHVLRAARAATAAASPRSARIGGAMPRDRARSSSSVSRVCASASSTVARGGLRVGVELVLGPAEVHREPDQPLLRAVVDVALEPAQRGRLGRDRGRGLRPRRRRSAPRGR